MGAAKPVCRQNPVDTFGGLAGFDCLIRVQIVQGAPGMGFDIADWFLFLGQILQHPDQQAVLVDIGHVPGVI